MIVTDRFADGDPSNNADVDRSSPDKRHGGDLLGIVHHMPYLQELGVTAIWITPVYTNPPEGYHGYHPLDFEKVDPRLCSPELGPSGSQEVVRRFVEIAHEYGLKVIFDAIICHTGPGHHWLQEQPTWFNIDGTTPEKWSIWGLPDLNHDNLDVNVYFVRNILEWMKTSGVDGVRIDAAKHVEKQFWRMFKVFVKGLKPEVTIIGEVWDSNPAQIAPYEAYHGFDSMFDYPLYQALRDVFAKDQGFNLIARPGLSDNELEGILNQDDTYSNAYKLITFIGNHDNPRFISLAASAGRREEALARTKLALLFLLTTRGIPQLYYGDELAMEGEAQPDNRRDMPWALLDEKEATSIEAKLAREMFQYTRELIHLRRSCLALRYGLQTTLYLTPTLYAYMRVFLDDIVIVVLNNSWETADVTVPIHVNPHLPSFALELLPNGLELSNALNAIDRTQIAAGAIKLKLHGKSGAVYQRVVQQRTETSTIQFGPIGKDPDTLSFGKAFKF